MLGVNGMTQTLRFSRQSVNRSVKPSRRRRGGEGLPESTASRSVRVLLVEDHPDTARAMLRLLGVQGFSVDCAATRAEALQALGTARYDVMVSDIGLPDGTGLELMRRARMTGRIAGIALSGLSTEHDVRRSRQAGFAVHITKPLNIQQLIESIERLVHSSN